MKVKKIQKKKYTAKQKRKSGLDNEIVGILLIAFGILTLLSFYFNNSIGAFGRGIRSFLFGTIGLPAFIIPPLIIVYAFFIMFNKSSDELKLRSIYGIILIILSSALIQVANYHPENYKNLNIIDIIGKFFGEINAEGVLFDGGVIGRLLSTPLLTVFQPLGTIIILTTLSIIDIILLTNMSIVNFIRNVRTLGANKSKKNSTVKNIKKSEYVQDDDMEIVGDNDNLSLAFKPKNKIIDFKIEKTSRELKEKTDKPVETGFEELPQEFLQDIPQELPIEEIEPKVRKKSNVREMNKIKEDVQKEIASAETENSDYLYPPIDLLIGATDDGKRLKQAKNTSAEVAKKLEDTLKSFGVDARVINVSRGPAVTRFELQPSPGVKVSKIVNLSDDISLNLAASGVRIEAPIPGKAAIGIEVPNKEMTAVLLKEVIESPEFARFPSKLAFSVSADAISFCTSSLILFISLTLLFFLTFGSISSIGSS
ncbi:MAG TPA: DNA translocase FtsK 4TM domain-containing protein [Clostridia bacterium]|nr:DNA translocase FtsK 4TM domain-containing protein [Clostridia bacterium]